MIGDIIDLDQHLELAVIFFLVIEKVLRLDLRVPCHLHGTFRDTGNFDIRDGVRRGFFLEADHLAYFKCRGGFDDDLQEYRRDILGVHFQQVGLHILILRDLFPVHEVVGNKNLELPDGGLLDEIDLYFPYIDNRTHLE